MTRSSISSTIMTKATGRRSVILRLPKADHAALTRLAKLAGVSMNNTICVLLAMGVMRFYSGSFFKKETRRWLHAKAPPRRRGPRKR